MYVISRLQQKDDVVAMAMVRSRSWLVETSDVMVQLTEPQAPVEKTDCACVSGCLESLDAGRGGN